MKTKEEIEEYKECIELAKIGVIDFLGSPLNKERYFTSDEIAKIIGMRPVFVKLALSNLTMRVGTHIVRVSIREDKNKFSVSYYGWELGD